MLSTHEVPPQGVFKEKGLGPVMVNLKQLMVVGAVTLVSGIRV